MDNAENTSMEVQGTRKAAIFLLSLEEDKAIKIIEHLSEAELLKIRQVIEQLGPVSNKLMNDIYQEFTGAFREGPSHMRGGSEYLKNLVAKAQGDDQAHRLFASDKEREALALPAAANPLANLSELDPEALRIAISEENPQIAAAVMAHINPMIAATIFKGIDPILQTDIICRIAELKAIPLSAFEDAEYGLGSLDLGTSIASGEIDGLSSAVAILNELTSAEANELLERLAEDHPNEAAILQRGLFTFENLIDADARGLQQLLREIQSDTLLVALKTASEPLKEKILSCMSGRAAAMLMEELELLPPMRVSDVDAAKQAIVEVAMRLMAEGKINVRGRGEDMV